MTGKQYRDMRESLKLTQPELAKKFKIDKMTISRIERSKEVKLRDEYAIKWLRKKMIGEN